MTTSATNSGKSYLGVDNRAVVTNIDTLFARLNAVSSSVGSLSWADVLANGAQATTDLDLNGNNATGAIRIQADSLESIVTLADSLIAYSGVRTLGNVDAATFSGDLTGSVTAGAGKTIDVSAGTLTLANDQISGNKVDGGRISNLEDLEADSLHGGWAEFTDSLLVRGDADFDGNLLVGEWARARALRADSSLAVSGAASNWNTAALGGSSSATGVNAVAIGGYASATNTQATAVGTLASAAGINAVAIGESSSAAGTQAVALGKSANAAGSYANVAVGVNASVASGWGNIAVGSGRLTGTGTPTHSVAIGASTISSDGAYNTSLGYNSTISGGSTTGAMTFGPFSSVSTGYRNMAFGANSAITGGNSNYTFGDNSSANGGWNSAAFGNYAQIQSGGDNAYAFGPYSSVSAYNAANFAYQSPARFSHLALFGAFADTTALAPGVNSANNWIATDPLFVVANGASDGARSNALTILKDGSATFADELSVGDTLHVAAPALFADSVYIQGNLEISGNLTVNGIPVGGGATYTAGTGVNINGSNVISIGQDVSTVASVQFQRATITEALTITPRSTPPSSATDGMLWLDNSGSYGVLKIYNQGIWWDFAHLTP